MRFNQSIAAQRTRLSSRKRTVWRGLVLIASSAILVMGAYGAIAVAEKLIDLRHRLQLVEARQESIMRLAAYRPKLEQQARGPAKVSSSLFRIQRNLGAICGPRYCAELAYRLRAKQGNRRARRQPLRRPVKASRRGTSDLADRWRALGTRWRFLAGSWLVVAQRGNGARVSRR